MMIGRLNNMDIADDWRLQRATRAKNERRFWLVALILSIGTLIVTWPKLSRADSITLDGRTEPATCRYETESQPDMGLAITAEICQSESWICRIQGGDMQCEVKR